MPEIYKKNYIKQAIFRIDFPSILKLIDGNPSSFQEQIAESFPSVEVIEHLMTFTVGDVQNSGETRKIWRFKSRDESRILEISPDYLVIIESKYEHFTSFSKLVNEILVSFQTIYTFPFIKRIGLRYVNDLEISNTEPTSISLAPYINQSLVCHLDFTEKQLLRTTNVTEFNYDDDRKVIFRYGLSNGNYPNKLEDSKFTLDFDCYNPNIIDKAIVLNELEELNKIATQLFEQAILEDLRTVMRKEV